MCTTRKLELSEINIAWLDLSRFIFITCNGVKLFTTFPIGTTSPFGEAVLPVPVNTVLVNLDTGIIYISIVLSLMVNSAFANRKNFRDQLWASLR